jgi:protein-S-isoprenylcysteine O-methyltransferase Ste14
MPHWNLSSIGAIQAATRDLWLIPVAVWVLTALTTKRTVQKQSYKSRFWQVGIVALGLFLLFHSSSKTAWFLARVLPATMTVAVLGLLITCLGIAFSIWARFTLGDNWSGTVTLKQEHTLVCRGPYRIVRHPIYTGLLIALTGTTMQYGQLRHFLGVLIIAFGFWLKSLTEEEFMVQYFGDQYLHYRQHVRALVPFIF